MLNLIEEGAEWPRQLDEARIVALAKSQPPSVTDVFDYRLLAMLPTIYRLWARMRRCCCERVACVSLRSAELSPACGCFPVFSRPGRSPSISETSAQRQGIKVLAEEGSPCRTKLHQPRAASMP